MTAIELTDVATASVYTNAGITLPTVDTNNNVLTSWTFCKLTLDSATSPPASKFDVIATVMPYGVDATGAAVSSSAVSRTCGFLVQAKSTSTTATTTSE